MTSHSRKAPLGYTTKSTAWGQDGHRYVATFTCAECQCTVEVPINRARAPEYLAELARNKGWDAHPLHKANARCPTCKAKGKPMPKFTPEENVVPIVPPKAVPEPTNDQRYAIRNKLDACFDDKHGCYLDGMTDQKIGALLNLPHILVTRLREAAYGPIRVDPITQQIEAKVADAAALIDQGRKLTEQAGMLLHEARTLNEQRLMTA